MRAVRVYRPLQAKAACHIAHSARQFGSSAIENAAARWKENAKLWPTANMTLSDRDRHGSKTSAASCPAALERQRAR
ncbi:hypothetical protein [Bradyrhizobium lablabi]|uniref:hypothetical protein n=1 Tax=Bradyrhizobium lablabi TaxID=722472 RepID=UPI001BAB0E01|nr:hypothetical protein [Bradyrhizobium lablabi]MBR0695590.1 hypothetical protein [Bradyrhizobium lablabi]